ncbi:nst1, partial [Ophiophagus hannah]
MAKTWLQSLQPSSPIREAAPSILSRVKPEKEAWQDSTESFLGEEWEEERPLKNGSSVLNRWVYFESTRRRGCRNQSRPKGPILLGSGSYFITEVGLQFPSLRAGFSKPGSFKTYGLQLPEFPSQHSIGGWGILGVEIHKGKGVDNIGNAHLQTYWPHAPSVITCRGCSQGGDPPNFSSSISDGRSKRKEEEKREGRKGRKERRREKRKEGEKRGRKEGIEWNGIEQNRILYRKEGRKEGRKEEGRTRRKEEKGGEGRRKKEEGRRKKEGEREVKEKMKKRRKEGGGGRRRKEDGGGRKRKRRNHLYPPSFPFFLPLLSSSSFLPPIHPSIHPSIRLSSPLPPPPLPLLSNHSSFQPYMEGCQSSPKKLHFILKEAQRGL